MSVIVFQFKNVSNQVIIEVWCSKDIDGASKHLSLQNDVLHSVVSSTLLFFL